MSSHTRSEQPSAQRAWSALRPSILRWVITLLVLIVHLGLGHADYTKGERVLAGFAGAIAFNVIWDYFVHRRRTLPVLQWVVAQMYVFFAMPVFVKGESTLSVSFRWLSERGAIRDALLATCMFLVMVLVGWIAVPSRKREAAPTRVRPVPLFIIIAYGLSSLLVSLVLTRHETALQGTWFQQLLWRLFLPAIAQLLLLFEYQRRSNARKVRLWLIAYTGLMVVDGLLSGRLSFALIPLVTAGMGLLATGAQIPKRLVLLVVLLLVLLNPAKHIYRQLTGYRTDDFATQSIGEMADAWIESFTQVWSDDEAQQDAFETTAKRLNSLTINAAVLDAVPWHVDYANGEPWLAVPYSLIPRVFWRDKPFLTEITNDRFALVFGMTTARSTETTTSAYPSVADGYWNFGWIGVLLAGFLVGLFWKLVHHAWSPASRYRYVFGFLIMIITYATSALPNLLLGVLQTAIACLIVVKSLEFIGTVVRGVGGQGTVFGSVGQRGTAGSPGPTERRL